MFFIENDDPIVARSDPCKTVKICLFRSIFISTGPPMKNHENSRSKRKEIISRKLKQLSDTIICDFLILKAFNTLRMIFSSLKIRWYCMLRGDRSLINLTHLENTKCWKNWEKGVLDKFSLRNIGKLVKNSPSKSSKLKK